MREFTKSLGALVTFKPTLWRRRRWYKGHEQVQQKKM